MADFSDIWVWLSGALSTPTAFFGALGTVTVGIWALMQWGYSTRITNRDDEITRLNKHAIDRDKVLTEQNGQIAALGAQIKDRDEQINTLKARCGDRGAQVANLTSELERVQSELEEANSKSIALRFVDPEPVSAASLARIGHRLVDLQKAHEPRRLADGQRASITMSLAGTLGNIQILVATDAEDGEFLREDFRQAFAAAGWSVGTARTLDRDASRTGLILGVGDPDKLTVHETKVHEALFAANLPHDLSRSASRADVVLRIVKLAK